MTVSGRTIAAFVVFIGLCTAGGSSLAQISPRDTRAADSATADAVRTEQPMLPPPKVNRPATHASSVTHRNPIWIGSRLAIVLGLFLGLILVQRWLVPRDRVLLTNGLFQICGKVSLDGKRSLQLVRVGQRLLVLLESPQGMQRLAEISDPTEVRRLLEAGGLARPAADWQRANPMHSETRHG
jgi:flagellar biogenesis protein FliO